MKLHFMAIAVCLLLLTGCGWLGPARIEISDTGVLEAKVSGISAGDLNFSCICDVGTLQTTTPVFMTIHNRGGEADRLVRVETDRAVKVELRQGGGLDDLTLAKPIEAVEIPALGSVEFRDGQYAMILTGVIEDIKPGDPVKLTLHFEKSGPVEVTATASERK